MVAARDAGYRAEVYGLTVLDLLDRFIGAKMTGAPGVKPWAASTASVQKMIARVHILPSLQDKALSDLGSYDCNFVVDLARFDEDGDERKASPLHTYRLLKQALEWGQRERLLMSVAWWADVKLPSYRAERRREFTGDEVERIVKAALERPDAALWLLMLERGLRTGEARGILRPNVDRRQRLIKITHQVSHEEAGGARLVKRLKTKNSYRDVPISALHLELIDRQIEHLKTLHTPEWREHGLLFPGDGGQPMDASILHRRWRVLLKDAGIADYAPPHTSRHTAISRMLRHIPITEVAAIAGDTPTTLLQTYAHAQIDSARPALERLDARGG